MRAVAAALTFGFAAAAPAAAALLSSWFPEGVPGFDTSPGVTVLSRTRPAFDPLGVRAGGFMFWPRLEESIGYDSNVLAGAQRHGSWTLGTSPSLLVTSDWSRGNFGAALSAADTRYPNLPAQGRTDGTLSAGGSMEIGRDRLTLAAAHIAQHQDRSDLDALPTDRPVAAQLDDARASYAIALGRWTVTPAAEASDWRFGNTTFQGAPARQAYRDRVVAQGGATARYDWSPLRSLLLVVRATDQHYLNRLPGQPSEDSTGYQAMLGIDFDDNAVWRYRLLVGGETRQFSAFHSHSDVIAEFEATWSPTGMVTARGTLTRSIEDAAQEGIAGFTYTAARITLDYEYRRNLLLNASASLLHADYLQSNASQSGYGLGLGVTWLVNRTVRLSATYDLTGVHGSQLNPAQFSGDYTRQMTLLTLRLAL